MNYELIKGRLYEIRKGRLRSVKRDYIVQDPNGNIIVQVSGKVGTFPSTQRIQNSLKAIRLSEYPGTCGGESEPMPSGANECYCFVDSRLEKTTNCNYYKEGTNTPEVDKRGYYVYRDRSPTNPLSQIVACRLPNIFVFVPCQ